MIAFGGRTLGDDKAKYLNSPESPIFKKGETLFGLDVAQHGIRRRDVAVCVEGYMARSVFGISVLSLLQFSVYPFITFCAG